MGRRAGQRSKREMMCGLDWMWFRVNGQRWERAQEGDAPCELGATVALPCLFLCFQGQDWSLFFCCALLNAATLLFSVFVFSFLRLQTDSAVQ